MWKDSILWKSARSDIAVRHISHIMTWLCSETYFFTNETHCKKKKKIHREEESRDAGKEGKTFQTSYSSAGDWWLVKSDQLTAHLSPLSEATIPQIYSPTSITNFKKNKIKKRIWGFHTINCHRHWHWTSLGSSSYCLYCSTYYYYVSCHHLSALTRMIPHEDDSPHLSDHMTSCPWGRSKLSAVYWASLHFQIDTAEGSSG